MKFIRRIIGNLTLPKKVYKDELGFMWISQSFIPKMDEFDSWYSVNGLSDYYRRDYSYPYNYRRLKQNWIGEWKLEDEYLGTHNKLTKIN